MLVRFSDMNITSSKKRRKMTAEKILTKHPLGKSGRKIDRDKYDTLRKAIVSALAER